MADVHDRLVQCFATVFPKLTTGEISSAVAGGTEGWDSVATVTLISIIEEEFGIEVESSDLERFASFESIHEYLKGR